MDFYSKIKNKLIHLKKKNLYREVKTFQRISGSEFYRVLDGKGRSEKVREVLCFCSNDYLGLASDPVVVENSLKEIRDSGVLGAGASRLVSGTQECHVRLEEALAQWKKKERAILFGSGYLANLALLSCLPENRDLILSDERNHASIWDGTRLSKAELVHYPHNDMDWLKSHLLKERDKYQQVFIVTDAVFSMDGDMVPLVELYRLSEEFQAILILDEAHSTGVLGKNGTGIESHFGVYNPNVILMGTLGKALGSYGAFVLGKGELIEYLIQRARPWIYTTALSPTASISAFYALRRIQEDPSLVMELKKKIRFFRESIQKSKSLSTSIHSISSIPLKITDTPIQPWILGSAEKTMQISEKLFHKGYFVQGIRPPTVPHGESRLRITLSRSHSQDSIEGLVQALEEVVSSDT